MFYIKSRSKIINQRFIILLVQISKTFIKFIDETPYFISSDIFQLVALTLANTKEKQEFYRCKGQENVKSDYIYPEINYTISNSDMLNITQVV